MIDCKCSFVATLIREDFACEQAQIVTRRTGPDVACTSEIGSQHCQEVYAELKQVGLPAFDSEDDLLKTPASVFNKIQFGGLLGLANLASNDSNLEKIDNIHQLVEQAIKKYETVKNIPYPELVKSMTTFKLKRKKRKNK